MWAMLTMVCLIVCGGNPQALTSELSHVIIRKNGKPWYGYFTIYVGVRLTHYEIVCIKLAIVA